MYTVVLGRVLFHENIHDYERKGGKKSFCDEEVSEHTKERQQKQQVVILLQRDW